MSRRITLRVPAIHCGGCVRTLTQVLEALPTVSVADADLATKVVRVDFDESAVQIDDIVVALDEIGFIPEEN